MPSLRVENWTAVMVPAATPDLIVDKLDSEILKILLSPEIEERARTQGFRVDARPAAKFAAFLNDEVLRWGKIIKAANITAE